MKCIFYETKECPNSELFNSWKDDKKETAWLKLGVCPSCSVYSEGADSEREQADLKRAILRKKMIPQKDTAALKGDETVSGLVAFAQVEAVRKHMQAELERLNLIDHTNKILCIKELWDTLVQAYKDVKFQGGLD